MKQLMLVVLVGLISVGYLGLSNDDLLMPLDDAYIHFQYARQMASGYPYQYNTGDEPTSGATSFIYSLLLALGYWIGFQGLALAYWAVAIGVLCLLGSAWLIHKMLPPDTASAYFLPMIFILTGAFSWAAFSGMETSLFVFAVLFALYAYQKQQKIVFAGVLVALVRPEGAVIALTLVLASAWQKWMQKPPSPQAERGMGGEVKLCLPILAIFIQPMVNWLVTGTPSATGNQAKSHLYNTTQPLTSRLIEIGETWLKIWWEFLTGYSPVDGWYQFPLMGVLALVMVVIGIRQSWQTRKIHPALLAGIWMFCLSIAIATLDTAQWHFKRYQLPMYALVFPLVGWLLTPHPLPPSPHTERRKMQLGWGLMLIFSLYTTFTFARYYHSNISVVKNQQMAMAEWVNANLPEDALVAVHDVGVMRYVGNRHTYDVVGLTTQHNASAWRQGVGTLYEHMAHTQPSYFAIYPDVLGLPFLVEAGVYGEELARFEIELPPHTAASATGTQVVTRADWSGVEPAKSPHQFDAENWRLVGTLNVADLVSEQAYNYTWQNTETIEGFTTLVRRLPYFACEAEPCTITDGGRVITGSEKFKLPEIDPDETYLILARVEAPSSAMLTVGCDSVEDRAVVPVVPGQWVEIPFLLMSSTDEFCLETTGSYFSYHYWIYAATLPDYLPENEFPGEFSDPFTPELKFQITEIETRHTEDTLSVNLMWQTDGKMAHDGKFFVHLYTNPSQPPIAQMDAYLNSLPPSNWLPGQYTETVTLPLADIPSGEYTLAVGFYDPISGQRYPVHDSDRLFLGDLQID